MTPASALYEAVSPAPSGGVDPTMIGAAVSKLVSASIGDIAVIMSRSPDYKFHSLADIEWLIMPAVTSAQYYVAEVAHATHGLRAPVACITWARVSDDVALRLSHGKGVGLRLRPQEWTSGPHFWLVDMVGDARALVDALTMLRDVHFKEEPVRLTTQDSAGAPMVSTLAELLTQAGSRSAS